MKLKTEQPSNLDGTVHKQSQTKKACIIKKNDEDLLNTLLKKGDIWRGHSRAFADFSTIDTGYSSLNKALVRKGWPQACLIEIGQNHYFSTWLLFAHAGRLLTDKGHAIALLNPPAEPCAVAMIQQGISLANMVLIKPDNKLDFIRCFIELTHSPAYTMVMAWQPKKALSYAELRKMQLASHQQNGLYVLFRHPFALTQSSCAALRILVTLHKHNLNLTLIKQRGIFFSKEVYLKLPKNYFPEPSYCHLDQALADTAFTAKNLDWQEYQEGK